MKLEKQEEEEMEKLLDEIPHATSPHHQQHQHPIPHAAARNADTATAINPRHGPPVHHDMYVGAAPLQHPWHGHGNGLMSQGSLSSPGSSSRSSDDGLRRSSEPGRRPMVEELGLLDRLQAMHVGNGGGERGIGLFGNGPADPYVLRNGYGNAGMRRPFDGDYGVVRRSVLPSTAPFGDDRRSLGLFSQQHYSNLSDSWIQARWSDAGYPNDVYLEQNWEDGLQLGSNDGLYRNSYHRGTYDDNSMQGLYQPPAAEAFPPQHRVDINRNWDLPPAAEAFLPQRRVDLNRNWDFLNSPRSLAMNGRPAAMAPANGWVPQSPSPVRNLRNVEAFGCEDSLIIQGKSLRFVGNSGRGLQREHKRLPQRDDRLHVRGSSVVNVDGVCSQKIQSSLLPPMKYDNLMDVEGYIYHIAKDQHGCRSLQRKFDEGKPHEVDKIFNGIINHVVELMVNPFGNYLMQKLLDVCTEEQRMKILLVLTENPTDLIRISLNTHGTRAVQKLIETLQTPQQIALVISALKPGFLDLIKDSNGNHVVQRCLQSLSPEDNKFIFDAATEHCVNIATHRHGCCVLQRCIGPATKDHEARLVANISANGLFLAQDAYGNYVIQYILDQKNSSATATLASQFESHYVNLSTQKCSSNVVEKCLKVFGEEDRARIIVELLSVPRFDQLLQDPYANYVIQSALGNSKGSLHAALVEAILPHATVLRTSPYCKRIFSRTLLRK